MKKNSFRLKEVLTGARARGWRNARSSASIDRENPNVALRKAAIATNRDRAKSLCCKYFSE
ncbi:hypothetical protein [Bradyrhizobium oligotrophicum]|uniref:hypothetical protein n=1 Tax=Bradyrhizobium oligotrophicum TaxID=44255 RepID=UPI003EBE9792